MAFTETQKTKICRMLGINAIDLDQQLATYAANITATVETEVGTLITEYFANSVNRNVTRIKAMDANFGAEINPEETRNSIRREVATLLFLSDMTFSQPRLVRA